MENTKEELLKKVSDVYRGYRLGRVGIEQRISVEVDAMKKGVTAKEFADIQLVVEDQIRK